MCISDPAGICASSARWIDGGTVALTAAPVRLPHFSRNVPRRAIGHQPLSGARASHHRATGVLRPPRLVANECAEPSANQPRGPRHHGRSCCNTPWVVRQSIALSGRSELWWWRASLGLAPMSSGAATQEPRAGERSNLSAEDGRRRFSRARQVSFHVKHRALPTCSESPRIRYPRTRHDRPTSRTRTM